MGVGRRKLAPLWALALTLAWAQHTGSVEHGHEYLDLLPVTQGPAGDRLRGVTILPPLRTAPVVRALNAAHNGRVCSTWGDFHYKTFDGDVFRFPGLCNYVLSAHCGAAYEDFNVQVRRGLESNVTTLARVTMKLDGMVIELTKSSIQVNGLPIQLPFSQSGVIIEHSSSYLKVVARLGLAFMWSQDDSLLLELDAKYSNQTCGLCGDFNGVPVFDEFLSHGVKLTPIEFGNLQKLHGPTEQCQDPAPVPPLTCSLGTGICEEILSSWPFRGCNALVDASSYVQACRQDLCLCEHAELTSCVCDTVAEYSRQCAHAGGRPLDWRGPDLCPQTCPLNMQYRECGSPCADTCSNPEHSQLCEDHCMAGCFCPEGTVLDDIGQTGCIPAPQCACVYNGATYAPGAVYSTDCANCTCSSGRWSCQEVPCPGTCSVLGGAHFSTFDERQYTVHGDCSYVLAKPCDSSAFTVLAELRRCGLTDSETCLKSLTLSLDGGHTVIVVKASGEVFVNQIYTQMPVSAANVTLFRPSTFFIIAQTNLGLQLDVQLVPTMQVFLRLAPELRGLTCGLCGNFNQNQADDFRTLSGVVEGTCHAAVSPGTYHSNCMFDTCNCQKSEDCLCAALSSYVRACAAKGVLLRGWRDGVCTKPMATCPKSLTYQYHISSCQPTCRARSHEDVTCGIRFVPVDGCACPQGTFMDEAGKCVPASSCPCYHEGSVVPNGESLHERGAICTCTQGLLSCIGGHTPAPVCTPPMVYVDCRNATPGAAGAGCQKSCLTLDMECYSPRCEPGCVCPDGLVADGEGGCVAVEDCPCVHDEASYLPGQTVRVGCNTCTCKSRMWQCTREPCLATCTVYGDGHYITFDGRSYSFSGDCAYTLLQDHCGGNSTANGTFRVVTENVPCGTTGVTCSKDLKLFLGSYELKLSGGKVEVIQKGVGQEAPYSIRQMGIYLVVDTEVGLVLLWDRKTSIFLKLSPEFKGRVCGLCGNFDDNAVNDFTTRSQSVVGNALEFGNSWKFSPSCADAPAPRDACTANPHRKSWAQKQCSVLNSATFAACHAHVEPAKYYEACVGDACACDSGGDCECLCTAVAAYAQACHDVGVCVSWRTPDICPLFCDYYNREGQCEWHYQPCGAPCMRTCRNPSGGRLGLRPLWAAGCYPKCPPEAPIFDEDQMQCVATCPTPPPPPPCRVQGKSYRPGEMVPSDRNCQSCVCSESGVQCAYDTEACVCTYDGRRFRPGDVIYHTTDGTGGCISARCSANGTIDRRVYPCGPTTPTPPTTFSFSTPPLVVSSTRPAHTCHSLAKSTVRPSTRSGAPSSTPGTTSSPPTSPPRSRQACGEDCRWSPWLDVSHPGRGIDSGDFDTLENLRAHGYQVCPTPKRVECRAEDAPEVPIQVLGQHVECSPARGLTCYNRKQASGLCHNYQIRVQCCFPRTCPTTGGQTQTTTPVPGTSTTTPSTSTPVPGTTTTTPSTSTPVPGTTTTTPSTSTPVPGTTTTTPSTSTPVPSTPTPVPGTTTTVKNTLLTSRPMPVSTTPEPCLQKLCNWTQWFDSSYPGPGINGGDFDTFHDLRAKGHKFCEKPSNVECRAQFFPNIPLEELGQDLICDKSLGLLCLNRNQLPPICYNYEIRIECCELVDVCRSTTHPVTSETTYSTREEPGTQTQLTWTTGIPSSPTRHSTASSVHAHPTTSITTGTHSVSPAVTIPCQPQCTWTKWFDVDFPSPGPHGGDVETFGNIVRRGEKICRRPEYITRLECRAESHPEVSIETLGQVVECNVSKGLVCRNRDQGGDVGMCLNYEVRVLCCEPPEYCSTHKTVGVPHTSSVSTTRLTETTSHLVTSSSTSVPKTSSTSVTETSPTSVTETSSTSVTETSSTSVTETRPTSVTETSSTLVTETSPTSVTETRPTSVTEISSTSVTETRPTSVTETSQTSVTESSPTSVTETRPTSVTETRPTSVTETSSTSVTETSPTLVTETSSTSVTETSPTSVTKTRPTSVTETSSTSVTETSPTSVTETSSTSVTETRPTSVTETSPTSVTKTRPTSVTETSPTSVTETSSTSVTETSSTSVTETSSISVTETRPTSVTETSPTSVTETSSTSVTETSPTSVTETRPTSVTETSPTSVTETSPTSVTKTSPTSEPKRSTTSGPTMSTSPVLKTETTHFTPVTIPCQPQCRWTKWFDVDFPSPGPHGGDADTLGNIVRRGGKICRRPEYITRLECRVESHPEVSIETLGQVVECNISKDLMCRNRDQSGEVGMCNYEVRVLCCEPPEHCPRTSVTPYATPSTKPSSPPEPTSVVSTTTCYCSVSDKFYRAGSIIYNRTDLDGHCYYATCSLDCHVVRTHYTCASGTTPPVPTTSPAGSSPSASAPVTAQGCPNAVPPRKKGETWAMPNCSQATCEGNGVITLQPRPCPQVQRPVCANGYPPVKVVDPDSCCPHYRCQCVCSGWGDPHYITFDGTYYTFLDNCTYVLVQQILPVYGHFRVLIDNYFCGAEDGLSCPQSIIVEYRQDRVVLTHKPVLGVMTNEIIFNDKVVKPGFQKDGVSVSQIGIKMYLTIPELGVQVMFSGLIFSVELPFSKFANNTEGQCGTCTNDKKDECRLPGGTVVPSCSDMSGHWKVTTPHQPPCHGPPPKPTAVGPTPSPAPCLPSPICQLILSEVFELCHPLIPPLAFYQGCTFDHCHLNDSNVLCSSLELYASLCASRGVCIDWRRHTNHTCSFTCPADKVYLPCGPSKPSYCYGSDNNTSLVALQDTVPITEGCFCPENMTHFSMSSPVCVPADCHRCLGPHGEAVEPGHTISVDCQRCTCESSTLTMSCHRQPCPLPPACPLPGFVPVPAAPQAGQCCPQYNCACDTSYCPKPVACPEGSHPVVTYTEGACCPSQNCSWDVCSVNGTLYRPGSVVSSSLCETCRCEVSSSPQLDTVVISCETQICNTHCPAGFEYQEQSGQCCGLCVQQACVVNASDSSTRIFYPGQSWPDPTNPCVTHECEKHRDGLVVVTRKKACPPLNCPAAQAQLSEDGCCLACPPPQPRNQSACAVYYKREVIVHGDCRSPRPTRVAYCQGNCGDSSAKYSLEANTIERNCSCCRELRVSPTTVTLRCKDGSSRTFGYTLVKECGCVGQQCGPRGNLSHSKESGPLQSDEEQSQETGHTGWRRGSSSPRSSRPPPSRTQR
ncbi:low quality protein: mucin-5ac [Lynx pardinus]|uniref:Low quality protein: mucin-5ac n=1 Tax=Lynx pardinus TaxID=191816 RepID=A0A485NKA4_LYNPA|nr:low quality protein: mucin-5ac [Lynx pardinus]